MLQILAATSNKHKIEEFRGAFRILEEKMKIITLDDIPAFPPAVFCRGKSHWKAYG